MPRQNKARCHGQVNWRREMMPMAGFTAAKYYYLMRELKKPLRHALLYDKISKKVSMPGHDFITPPMMIRHAGDTRRGCRGGSRRRSMPRHDAGDAAACYRFHGLAETLLHAQCRAEVMAVKRVYRRADDITMAYALML